MKIRRVIALLMACIILTFNLQVRRVQAEPLTIAGIAITAELVAYVGCLMVASGITFYDTAKLYNATVDMAYYDLDSFKKMVQPYVDALQSAGGSAVSSVKVAVSTLKDIFNSVSDSLVRYFDIDSSAISTSNAEYVYTYYDGIPVFTVPADWLNDYRAGAGGYLSVPGNELLIDSWLDSRSAIYKSFLGESYVNSVGGISAYVALNGETNNFGDIYQLYRVNANGSTSALNTFNLLEQNYVYYANGFYCLRLEGQSSSGFGLYYMHNNLSTSDGSNGTVYYLLNSSIRYLVHSYPNVSSEEFVPDFTATLNPTNVFDDTVSYSGTLDTIADVVGTPVTDADELEIVIPVDSIGVSLEDIIRFPGIDVDVPDVPIDVPDVPIDVPIDIPAVPDIPVDLPADIPLDFSGLKLNAGKLLTVFPFCIPFDFVSALSAMHVAPSPPVYEMNFSGTVFGNYVWSLDLSEYESLAQVVRWCVWIGFFIGLIITTRKFIRW